MVRLCLTLLLAGAFLASANTWKKQSWTYKPTEAGDGSAAKPFGLNQWNEFTADAEGHQYCGKIGTQSPIDATFATATPFVGSGDMNFTLTNPIPVKKATLEMNAHTTEVVMPAGAVVATWKGKPYYLHQYHYHSPSEHTLDGKYYPMEVHHVFNSNTDGKSGDYLVLGVFIGASNALQEQCTNVTSIECNRARFMDALQRKMPGPTTAKPMPAEGVFEIDEDVTGLDPLQSFIPLPMTHYYHYNGSFTTPGCNPNVSWILNPTPVTIFNSTLQFYREHINSYPEKLKGIGVEGNPGSQLAVNASINMTSFQAGSDAQFTWNTGLGLNNRPIQQLNAATPTREFYIIGQAPSGSTVLTAPVAAGATMLPVSSQLGFQVGQEILIGVGPQQEVRTINAFGSIIVNAALQYAHAIGTQVVVKPPTTTATVTTTRKPPFDSSASSSGTSNSLASSMSSSASSESDVSGSYESSSDASGSSGFFMSLWKWFLLAGLLCCCLIAVAAICASMGKPKPKPKSKKKATPPPKPVEETKEEEFPLMDLPPLVPLQSFGTQAMPVTYAAPMTTSYAAPMTTSYAAPATYSTGYPAYGQVV